MAGAPKILVFDSGAELNSAGEEPLVPIAGGPGTLTMANAWANAIDINGSARTYPVRIFSPVGDISIVGWEFIALSWDPAVVISLRWWMEYFNDDQSLDEPPILDGRQWKGVDDNGSWARELVAVSGGGGAVTMTPALRTLNLGPQNAFGGKSPAYYAPLSVYGMWVRLGFYVSIADSTLGGGSVGDYQVKIFAHTGGHSERAHLRRTGDRPYAYTAFNDKHPIRR